MGFKIGVTAADPTFVQLLSRDEYQPDPQEVVFQERTVWKLWAVVASSILGANSVAAALMIDAPLPVRSACFFMGAVLELGAFVMLPGALRGMRRRWAARAGLRGLYLRLSAVDPTTTAEASVVKIDWAEVASVTSVTIERTERRAQADHYLEVRLIHEETDHLGRALRSVRHGGKASEAPPPLRLATPNRLWVGWNLARHALSPGLDETLSLIGRRVAVDPPLEMPAGAWDELDTTRLEELAQSLAHDGAEVQAVSLLRVHHGWDAATALAHLSGQDLRQAS
ncbi:MAG: hypothetical protein V3T22_12450 [Planctomycetota bacterium]